MIDLGYAIMQPFLMIFAVSIWLAILAYIVFELVIRSY